MTRTITIESGGNAYGGQIGTIKSTRLGYQDHGILTADLAIEWPGGGVSVGGYSLDTKKDDSYDREGTAYGLDHIIWIMRTVGVERWEDLVGKQVIVLFEGQSTWGARSVGIASTTDEKEVLVLKEHAEMWKERTA